MDTGHEKGRSSGYFGRMWLFCSLEQKVRYTSRSTAAVVALSIAANILMAGFGMWEFNSVLRNNSQTLSLWPAISEESNTSVSLVNNGDGENRMKFETAGNGVVSALRFLPFDYGKIGVERYTGTWPTSNLYENYARVRDEFLKTNEDDQSYPECLYTIYYAQGYLDAYATRLEQMTVEVENKGYQR